MPTEAAVSGAFQYRNDSWLDGSPTSDGKPAMLAYHGSAGQLVVWSDVPLWLFDRTQLRQLAEVVLRNMGVTKKSNRLEWTGPGAAAPGGTASSAPKAARP